jgi:hypothetical protein
MSNKLLLILTLLILAPFPLSAEKLDVSLDQRADDQASFGSYLFGFGNGDEATGVWPCNFWSNYRSTNFVHDLDVLQLEGGNAVIVLFPYFDVAAPQAARRLAQLRELLAACEQRNVRLTLRLGYAWDNGFRDSAPRQQVALLVEPEQRKRWYEYCDQTYKLASQYRCFVGSFISWEDFWGLLAGASLNEDGRRQWARHIAYPNEIVPARNERRMEEFFDYFDQLFAGDFFASTRRHVPNLGIEVRMDDDPVFDGTTYIKSFVHRKIFAAPGLRDAYLYWGPFMGARNESDLISAETATNLLVAALRKARNLVAPETKLIMAQFNYVDNTPGFSRNSRIAPDQIKAFIGRSSEILRQYCSGTYVWSNVSYSHNAVNNGTFSTGSDFWIFEDALAGIEQDQPCVTIFPGGSITQQIGMNTAVSAGLAGSTRDIRVEFSAKPVKKGSCTVSLGGTSVEVPLTDPGSWRRYVAHFDQAKVADQSVRLSVENGALVDDIILTNHVQQIGARDKNFSRDVLYGDLAWDISRGQSRISQLQVIAGVEGDNWITSSATFGVPVHDSRYHIVIAVTVPDFVEGQTVRISILPDGPYAETQALGQGQHELVVSGSSTKAAVYLSVSFGRQKRSPSSPADIRELAAHLDSISP